MTEQEMTLLIETEQRSKSNSHRLDSIETEIRDIKNDQKAIYSIATSVEVIAQRVTSIEDKIDDMDTKVDAQSKALAETESKFAKRVSEAENKPLKQLETNANSIKVAIVTAICTLLASGIIEAIIAFNK